MNKTTLLFSILSISGSFIEDEAFPDREGFSCGTMSIPVKHFAIDHPSGIARSIWREVSGIEFSFFYLEDFRIASRRLKLGIWEQT